MPIRRLETRDRSPITFRRDVQSRLDEIGGDVFAQENPPRTQISASLNEGRLGTVGLSQPRYHDKSCRGWG
jgi:hypothetical protein